MKFDVDSRFFHFCARLVELVQINLLWLVCCLPIVTIGAATTAMHTCLYAWKDNTPCGGKAFFAAFRASFARATILWLGILLLGVLLVLDYTLVVYLNFPGHMAVICVIFFIALALLLFCGMVFPLLSQFPMGVKDTMVNAILLSLAHLPKLLLITAANLLPLALALLLPRVFLITGFVWLLCGFSLLVLYDIRVLEPIFAPFRTVSEETN